MKNINDEYSFLDTVADTYTVDVSSQTRVMRELAIRAFAPFLRGGTCLELGCSDGYMTESLSKLCDELQVVDGSKKFLEKAKQRSLTNVTYHYGLFEDFDSSDKFDHIVASYIRARKGSRRRAKQHPKITGARWEAIRGRAKCAGTVPAMSVHMNFLPNVYALTPNDHKHGHRRTYDRTSLNRDFEQTVQIHSKWRLDA